MTNKISRLNSANIMSSIIKYGTHILFVMAVIVLSYLSFVQNLSLDPSIRNITTIALVALVLNYLIWDSYYKLYYNNTMANDIANEKYCIHRRFYYARKGWGYIQLQNEIRKYNQNFRQNWLDDVEDATGYKINDVVDPNTGFVIELGLVNGPYKHRHCKLLIWRIKHRKYPKSGISSPRQLLNVLRVGKTSGTVMKINAAEIYHGVSSVKKILTAAASTFLAAALAYDFISPDGVRSALLKLILLLLTLFMSFFFGSVSGTKGAQIKLGVAEEVSELFEIWKNESANEEPYPILNYYENNSKINKAVKTDIEPIKENDIEQISVEIT